MTMNENPYAQCQECGKILSIPERGKMWCNSCRIKRQRHEETIEAMKQKPSADIEAKNASLIKEILAMQDALDNVQGEANLEEIQILNTKLKALQTHMEKIHEEAKYPNADSIETLGEIMEISSQALKELKSNV